MIFMTLDDQALIPGMGPEDKVELGFAGIGQADPSVIPGLDFDSLQDSQKPLKKVIFLTTFVIVVPHHQFLVQQSCL